MTNRYVFLFAAAMVVIVAVILSGAATLLRPFQERNMRLEKMQNILAAINIEVPREDAQEVFEQYITRTKIVNHQGEELEGDAFEVNLQDENRKPVEERQLPVYIGDFEGETFYVLPVRGTGLWGPIWGYVGLESDLVTIAGANFDHSSETPGLGAEIADENFEEQFTGKKIFDEEGSFRPVRVVKGGAPPGDEHAVDAISGGTITSNGVTDMMRNGLEVYTSYFEKIRTS
ncbi:MAG: NADH:ubiquinone reductase (Na(+)-transporting) subunit C [Bacteroidales bacterium]